MQVCSVNNSNTNFKAFVYEDLSNQLILEAKSMGVLPKYMEQAKLMERFGNTKSYFSVIKDEINHHDVLALSNPHSYSINDGKFMPTQANLYSTGETLIEQFLSTTINMIYEAQKELDKYLH